jgi:ATP-binding cassette subfamily B protein
VTRGRTSVIVSHRLSTIKMADKIIVLEGDRVMETGTYTELISNKETHFSHMIRSLSDAGS